MSTFDDAVKVATIRELKDTRRVLHLAGNLRARAGWLDPEWPLIVEATCAVVSAELAARGDPFGPCYPCQVGTTRLSERQAPPVTLAGSLT